MKKKGFLCLICLLLVCAMVAGCGGGAPTQGTTGGTQGTQNSGTEPTNTEKPDVPKDEPVKLYLLTEQKNYYNGILEATATFTYDEQGLPLTTEWVAADGESRKQTLEYDAYGTLIRYSTADFYPQYDDTFEDSHEFAAEYTDGKLTKYGIGRISYDDAGRMTHIQYDTELGQDWQRLEYDDQGRLVTDTSCSCSQERGDGGYVYRYSLRQHCYEYNEQGQLVRYYVRSAKTQLPEGTALTPEEAEKLDYQRHDSGEFLFYYDELGRLAYCCAKPYDCYQGGTALLYRDENCQFDENGNLISKTDGLYKTEYSYTCVEVPQEQAQRVRNLLRFLVNDLQVRTEVRIDPLFDELVTEPMSFYSPLESVVPHPVYDVCLPVAEIREPVASSERVIYVVDTEQCATYKQGHLRQSWQAQRNTYDENGVLLQSVTQDKNYYEQVWSAETDDYGRIIRLVCQLDGKAYSTEYTYDAWGNVAAVTQAVDGVVSGGERYSYDQQGKQLLTETLSADGTVTKVVSWVYNEQGQLIQRLYYEDASAGTPYGTDTFTYSKDGLTRTMTSTLQVSLSGNQKTVIATFDEFGNLLREETISGSTSTVREFSYRAVRIPADWPRNH